MTDCQEMRVTDWVTLKRWPDCVTVHQQGIPALELSGDNACTLGRWLIEYGTKLKTSEAGVASPPATGETPASD